MVALEELKARVPELYAAVDREVKRAEEAKRVRTLVDNTVKLGDATLDPKARTGPGLLEVATTFRAIEGEYREVKRISLPRYLKRYVKRIGKVLYDLVRKWIRAYRNTPGVKKELAEMLSGLKSDIRWIYTV